MHQLEITERMIRLRGVPFFRSMPAGELAQLASTLRLRSWTKGEVILSEDAPPTSFVLVGTGRVGMTRKGRRIGTVRAPGGVGFLSYLAQAAGGTHCVAESFVEGYEVTASVIDEIFEDHFAVLFGSLRWIAARLLPEMQQQTPPPFEPPKLPMEHLIGDRPLGVVERIFLVRRMRAFARANVNTLAAMVKRMEEVRVPEGTVLWRPGDASVVDGAQFIVKGRASLSWDDGRKVQRLGGGYVVGGLESILGEPRWNTFTVDEDCVILRGKRDVIVDMLEDDHELARTFLAQLSLALMETWDRKAEQGIASVGRGDADDDAGDDEEEDEAAAE